MATYNKSDLLSKVAGDAGVSKGDAEAVLNAFFATVTESAKSDGKVAWAGFGSFSASHRAARVGRNPRTGEALNISASTSVKFTAAKALKEQLNS